MTRTPGRMVDCISRLLNERDREAVLGDLEEEGESQWQAATGIVSLLLRREAEHWPTWTAALLMAVPGSLLLLGFSLTVSHAYHSAFFDTTGLTVAPGIWLLLCNLLIVAAWTWTGGRVASPVSRRALWMSVALGFAPCAFCFTRFDVESLSRLSSLLLLFPALLSVLRGHRIARMGLRQAIVFAAGLTVLTIPTWALHGSWLPNWILSWPAWYLVGTAQRTSTYASE